MEEDLFRRYHNTIAQQPAGVRYLDYSIEEDSEHHQKFNEPSQPPHQQPHQQQHQQDYDTETAVKSNLIVNYLPHDIDDTSLKGLFAEFGDILVSKVVRDKNTKKSLGYGFVKFLKEDDAYFAIEKMNGLSLGHKNLKVSMARPPSTEIRNCKLYVTNLPKDYGERDVVLLFKEFGEIIECRVLKDKNARSNKGVAFVQFNLKSQANNALALNGCQLEGSSRGLIVKYAEDQHKKKELHRLHNLTANNSYRAMGMPGGMSGMQADSRAHQLNLKSDPLAQTYYYQQQNMNAAYGGPHSPLHSPMLQHPHSPISAGHIYLPSTAPVHPSMLDYGSNKPMATSKPQRGMNNKNIPFPIDTAEMSESHQQNTWYTAISPQHLSYLQTHHDAEGMHSLGMGISPPPSPQQHIPHHMQQQQLSGHHQSGLRLQPPNSRGGASHQQLHITPHSPPQSPTSLTSPYSVGPVCLDLTHLPSDADVALLYELFTPYGRILNAQVDAPAPTTLPPSADGSDAARMCSGRGKVQMAGFAQAEYAAQALNGAIIFEGAVPIQVEISAGSITQAA